MNSIINPPRACLIEVVDTCFMKCKMCYHWQKAEYLKGFSIEDWKTFLDSLKEIVPVGIPLCFTGRGEPLAREGILELIEAAIKKGFIVQMPTNGYLIDENMAKRLSEAGLNLNMGLSVSLDSLNEQTHDFLRGIEGTHARVMKAIKCLRKYKIGFAVSSIIMGKNLNDIIELVRWSVKENICIRFQAVSKPFKKDLADNWYKTDEWKFLWPEDIGKAKEIIDELIKLKESGVRILNPAGQLEIFKAYFENPQRPYRLRNCNVGNYLMNMDMFGNLSPCSVMGAWGNVKETHIRDLWFSERAQVLREKIHLCQRPCHYLINCFHEE